VPRTTTSDVAAKLAGEGLREARKRVGLTQAQVAREIGATPPYISNIEAGRVNLTLGQLFNLADAIGVEVELGFRAPEAEEAFGLLG
jgi:transcriptional regulator with XRE-family HTH domain